MERAVEELIAHPAAKAILERRADKGTKLIARVSGNHVYFEPL